MAGEKGVYALIAISLAILFIVLIIAAAGTYFHVKLPVEFWLVSLFFLTFAIGILAPVAGVGGGVIFVPVVSAFYPFSITFVRGAGLVMAQVNALVSVPKFLRVGLASLRIGLLAATVAGAAAIAGAKVGIWVVRAFPQGKYYIYVALGVLLLFIFVIMITSKRVEFPEVREPDRIARLFNLTGAYYEPALGRVIEYKVTRTGLALLAFAGVGFIAGMFGLGAGWANVPVLNLIMGAPIKVATSTSMLIIALTTTPAACVYLADGAILPLIMIPAVVGMFFGSRLGAWLTVKARPKVVRYIFLAIMLFAAIMDIYKGLHGLGFV